MKIFVKDLKNGDYLTDQVFSLDEFQQHTTRAQQPYYRMTLQDKTGEISAKIWHDDFANCHMKGVEAGDAVKIDGEVNEYNGQLQLIIKKLDKTEDYDITDLLQSSDRDISTMYNSIQGYVSKVKNKDLSNLLNVIFSDSKFVNLYKRSPAAELVHHDFVGGLMEHTLELVDMSEPLLKYYPEADGDLVTTGIILLDIGKIFELEVQKTALARTVKGRLIGHIVQGIELIKGNLPKDFPDALWMKLLHIIISHQGELEFGSPVKPATLEAAIVYVLDKASSHVRQFQKALNLGEGRTPGFSDYQKYIGTQVYLE